MGRLADFLAKATKRGAGGKPQTYDPSTGRYGSGASPTSATDDLRRTVMDYKGREPKKPKPAPLPDDYDLHVEHMVKTGRLHTRTFDLQRSGDGTWQRLGVSNAGNKLVYDHRLTEEQAKGWVEKELRRVDAMKQEARETAAIGQDPNLVFEAMESWDSRVMAAYKGNPTLWLDYHIRPEVFREDLGTVIRQMGEGTPGIHIDATIADRILADGGRFQSQFETGTSTGTYSPRMRRAQELEMFGYDEHMDDYMRPIYGAIRRDGLDGKTHAEHYGELFVEFGNDDPTITFGDSLGMRTYPIHQSQVQGASTPRLLAAAADAQFSTYFVTQAVNYLRVAKNRTPTGPIKDMAHLLDADQRIEGTGDNRTDLRTAMLKVMNRSWGYTEAQFHGGFVNIDSATGWTDLKEGRRRSLNEDGTVGPYEDDRTEFPIAPSTVRRLNERINKAEILPFARRGELYAYEGDEEGEVHLVRNSEVVATTAWQAALKFGYWQPVTADEIEKATKIGAGGKPQLYDPSTGRYGAGGAAPSISVPDDPRPGGRYWLDVLDDRDSNDALALRSEQSLTVSSLARNAYVDIVDYATAKGIERVEVPSYSALLRYFGSDAERGTIPDRVIEHTKAWLDMVKPSTVMREGESVEEWRARVTQASDVSKTLNDARMAERDQWNQQLPGLYTELGQVPLHSQRRIRESLVQVREVWGTEVFDANIKSVVVVRDRLINKDHGIEPDSRNTVWADMNSNGVMRIAQTVVSFPAITDTTIGREGTPGHHPYTGIHGLESVIFHEAGHAIANGYINRTTAPPGLSKGRATEGAETYDVAVISRPLKFPGPDAGKVSQEQALRARLEPFANIPPNALVPEDVVGLGTNNPGVLGQENDRRRGQQLEFGFREGTRPLHMDWNDTTYLPTSTEWTRAETMSFRSFLDGATQTRHLSGYASENTAEAFAEMFSMNEMRRRYGRAVPRVPRFAKAVFQEIRRGQGYVDDWQKTMVAKADEPAQLLCSGYGPGHEHIEKGQVRAHLRNGVYVHAYDRQDRPSAGIVPQRTTAHEAAAYEDDPEVEEGVKLGKTYIHFVDEEGYPKRAPKMLVEESEKLADVGGAIEDVLVDGRKGLSRNVNVVEADQWDEGNAQGIYSPSPYHIATEFGQVEVERGGIAILWNNDIGSATNLRHLMVHELMHAVWEEHPRKAEIRAAGEALYKDAKGRQRKEMDEVVDTTPEQRREVRDSAKWQAFSYGFSKASPNELSADVAAYFTTEFGRNTLSSAVQQGAVSLDTLNSFLSTVNPEWKLDAPPPRSASSVSLVPDEPDAPAYVPGSDPLIELLSGNITRDEFLNKADRWIEGLPWWAQPAWKARMGGSAPTPPAGPQTATQAVSREAVAKAALPDDFWSGGWQQHTLSQMLKEGWDVLSIGVAQGVRSIAQQLASRGALGEVLAAIEAGQFTTDGQARILAALTDLTVDPGEIRAALTDAHAHGLTSAAKGVQARGKKLGIDVPFSFDDYNPESVRWAATRAGNLVVEITDEQRRMIRGLVDRSIVKGEPPAKLAKDIRQVVGLHSRWANAVQSYEQRLLKGGMPAGQAREMASIYAERLRTKRAKVIARTETLQAQNEGQRMLWRSMRNEGFIPGGVQRKWLITGDDKLCPYCQQMVGERAVADLEGYFDTPKGMVSAPPMHPNCRCAQVLVVPDPVEFAKALKLGAGGKPQVYDPATGRYGSGTGAPAQVPGEVVLPRRSYDDASPEERKILSDGSMMPGQQQLFGQADKRIVPFGDDFIVDNYYGGTFASQHREVALGVKLDAATAARVSDGQFTPAEIETAIQGALDQDQDGAWFYFGACRRIREYAAGVVEQNNEPILDQMQRDPNEVGWADENQSAVSRTDEEAAALGMMAMLSGKTGEHGRTDESTFRALHVDADEQEYLAGAIKEGDVIDLPLISTARAAESVGDHSYGSRDFDTNEYGDLSAVRNQFGRDVIIEFEAGARAIDADLFAGEEPGLGWEQILGGRFEVTEVRRMPWSWERQERAEYEAPPVHALSGESIQNELPWDLLIRLRSRGAFDIERSSRGERQTYADQADDRYPIIKAVLSRANRILWERTHGSVSEGRLHKATKIGAGGKPQSYDPSTGRYGGGGAVSSNTDDPWTSMIARLNTYDRVESSKTVAEQWLAVDDFTRAQDSIYAAQGKDGDWYTPTEWMDAVRTWQNTHYARTREYAKDIAKGQDLTDMDVQQWDEWAADAIGLMDAVDRSPRTNTTLYRGLALFRSVMEGHEYEGRTITEAMKPGDIFEDPLGSWSSEENVAIHIGTHRTKGPRKVAVILEVENPKAVFISALDNDGRALRKTAREYHSGGRYEVLSVEKVDVPLVQSYTGRNNDDGRWLPSPWTSDTQQAYRVRVRQIGTYAADGSGLHEIAKAEGRNLGFIVPDDHVEWLVPPASPTSDDIAKGKVRGHLRSGVYVQAYERQDEPRKETPTERMERLAVRNAERKTKLTAAMEDELGRLAADYPEVGAVTKLVHITAFRNNDTYARFEGDSRGGQIQWNYELVQEFAKKLGREDDVENIAREIVTHEFGHAVHNLALARITGTNDRPSFGTHNTDLRVPVTAELELDYQRARAGDGRFTRAYALKDRAEFFAEAFLARRMGWTEKLPDNGDRFVEQVEGWAERGVSEDDRQAWRERQREWIGKAEHVSIEETFEGSWIGYDPNERLMRKAGGTEVKVSGHLRQGHYVHGYTQIRPVKDIDWQPKKGGQFDGDPTQLNDLPKEVKQRLIEHQQETFGTSYDDLLNNVRRSLDAAPPEAVKAGMRWYVRAGEFVRRVAKQTGIDGYTFAGMVAALSPQHTWPDNKKGAEYMARALSEDWKITQDVLDVSYTKRIRVGGKEKPVTKTLEEWMNYELKSRDQQAPKAGTRLSDMDPVVAGSAIKAMGQAGYRSKPGDYSKTPESFQIGENIKVPWGCGLRGMSTAVTIFRGGVDGMDHALNGHKVRSFVNDIFFSDMDPTKDRTFGATTVDVHALSMMLGHTMKTPEQKSQVKHGFEGPKQIDYNLAGTYPVFAQAIRDVAAERGILPHQAQAIAWLSWQYELGNLGLDEMEA